LGEPTHVPSNRAKGGNVGGFCVLPGILVQSVVMITMYTGMNLKTDIDKGISDRIRTLPIWRPAALTFVSNIFVDPATRRSSRSTRSPCWSRVCVG